MTSIVTQIFEEHQLEIKVYDVNYRFIETLLIQI
jgi:cell fate regulator YaaT (PSP1 superfamily)